MRLLRASISAAFEGEITETKASAMNSFSSSCGSGNAKAAHSISTRLRVEKLTENQGRIFLSLFTTNRMPVETMSKDQRKSSYFSVTFLVAKQKDITEKRLKT